MTTEISILGLTIDWSPFMESERQLIETAINRGDVEHLAAIINEVTPEKAKVIAEIQAKLRPKTFVFESDTQKQAEEWMQNNPMTPEKEAEWQAKIDAEKIEKMTQAGILPETIKSIDTSDQKHVRIDVHNDLTKIKGLGEASVKKLLMHGIDTVEKFTAMSEESLSEILSPVVISNLKKHDNE